MIVPDVNLLVYAHHVESPMHAEARDWWDGLLNGADSVGLSWTTLIGFIRISTNPRILKRPLDPAGACARVRDWLDRSQSVVIHPGDRHVEILFQLLDDIGTAGNLTTDAHLAALAIEHQAELHSADADMGRFKGLRWVNPLSA